MTRTLTLLALDLGSTTLRIAVAEARVVRSAATGRSEIGNLVERFRADPVRSPFLGDALDQTALLRQIDAWLAAAGVPPGSALGGGALLTGLAARAPNAEEVVEALRLRMGDAVVATARDPHLEAWLAFQGNLGELSRASPTRLLLNLDIGGGTTNLALGQGGEVLATSFLWLGARHIEVEPGSYRMTGCSPEGRRTLDHLKIDKHAGDTLSREEVESILDVWIHLLESAVLGEEPRMCAFLMDGPLDLPAERAGLELAFSGGVGALFHDLRAGQPLPGTTYYGDLGIDLARRIHASARLEGRAVVCESLGRATVYGLLRHQTQVSGATVLVPPDMPLPAGDLPIVGSLGPDFQDSALRRLVALCKASPGGGCIAVRGADLGREALSALGKALGKALRDAGGTTPLVLLVPQNGGKALGGYATDWGLSPAPLVVLDEVAPGGAGLVRIGKPSFGVIPLSFHRLSH